MMTDSQNARITFTTDEAESVRLELNRILASPLFQGSKRCHDFLQHIVMRTLEGERDGLSERFLGAELFGRAIDYDTKSDSIVRVRANDVRRRLGEYYADQHSSPTVVVTLGAGSYVPEFHWPDKEGFKPVRLSPLVSGSSTPLASPAENELHVADQQDAVLPSSAATGQRADHALTAEDGAPDSEREVASNFGQQKVRAEVSRRVVATGAILAGLLILSLVICSFTLWQELRSVRRSLYPWQNSPAVAGLWGNFLGDERDTDLVVTDSSFSLVEMLTNKSFSLNDYLGHSYMGQLQDQDPRMASALSIISNWGLGSSGEFEAAQHLLTLDPTRQKLHFYLARKYEPDLLRRDNVILMGSQYGNPWAELFERRMNFTFDPRNPYEILNRAPKPGESAIYNFDVSTSVGFCIIAYLPTPDHNGSALLIQGTSGEPTKAGVDFLLSETKLSDFQRTLGVSKLPYFEMLLKTSWVKGAPIDSSIVAYRTYTGSN